MNVLDASPEATVIVPTLDEADTVSQLLDDLARQTGVALDVVVVDGGSSDGTVAAALDRGARVIAAEKGRARQMNAGHDVAESQLLLFLHADTRLPRADLLRDAFDAFWAEHGSGRNDRVAGHFAIRFRDVPDDVRPAFRFLEAKTALNRRHTTSGDQGLLIGSDYFDELGGFDETLTFLEDQRLGEKIYADGAWFTLPGTIETSARRFLTEGFATRYFAMAAIMSAWNAGVDEFFEIGTHLYRPQPETAVLPIEEVLTVIEQTLEKLPAERRRRVWESVGAYAIENVWQIFFAADVALREDAADRHDFLDLYDRVIAPLLDTEVARSIAAVLVRVGVMAVLPELSRARGSRLSSSPA